MQASSSSKLSAPGRPRSSSPYMRYSPPSPLFCQKLPAFVHGRFILKGHVDDGGITSHGCRRCPMFIILPPFIPRIIEVGVGVNGSWKYIFSFCINHLCSLRLLPGLQQGGNPAVLMPIFPSVTAWAVTILPFFTNRSYISFASYLLLQGSPFPETLAGRHMLHAEIIYQSCRYGCRKEGYVYIDKSDYRAHCRCNDGCPVDS